MRDFDAGDGRDDTRSRISDQFAGECVGKEEQ